MRTKRGRNYASMIYGRSVAGTLEATLVNYDGAYDRFAASSDLQGLLLPRRRILFALAADSKAYRLWSGFLDEAKKVARTGGNDVVKLRATDLIGNLARTDCGVPYLENITVAEAVTAVLDAAGIDAGDRGAFAANTAISTYFAADAKALLHLRQLEEAEAGFLWVTAAGKLRFDGVNQRYQQSRSRSAQVKITDQNDYGVDDLPILPPPQQHDPLKDIANIVTVQVRAWQQASEAELWRLPEVVQLDPGASTTFVVAHGGSTLGRNAQSGRFEGSRDQAVSAWIAPEPATDYTTNSFADGSGVDLTDNLAVALAGLGTSARLRIENQHASLPLFVTLLKVRGHVLTEEQPAMLELRDEDSIADYGPRPYTVASDLLTTVADAHIYAQYILQLYAQPTRKAEVRVPLNDQLSRAGTLELSDRVEFLARGISTDMYIESISHLLQPGLRHDLAVTLSQAGLFDDVIIIDGGPGLDTGILGA